MTLEIYRKRPLPVRALQMDGSRTSAREALAFINQGRFLGSAYVVALPGTTLFCVKISTLEGTMTAMPGDWIICGVAGEFYPCKDEIFRKTYEPAVVEVVN